MNNRKRQKIKHIRGAKLSKLQIWNLHQTLAAYIAGGLRQFMNREIYGFPSDLEKDAEVDPDGSIAMNEWRNILKEMLWSFDQIARNEYPPLNEMVFTTIQNIGESGHIGDRYLSKSINITGSANEYLQSRYEA